MNEYNAGTATNDRSKSLTFNATYGIVGMGVGILAGSELVTALNDYFNVLRESHYAARTAVDAISSLSFGAMVALGAFAGGFTQEGLRLQRSRKEQKGKVCLEIADEYRHATKDLGAAFDQYTKITSSRANIMTDDGIDVLTRKFIKLERALSVLAQAKRFENKSRSPLLYLTRQSTLDQELKKARDLSSTTSRM